MQELGFLNESAAFHDELTSGTARLYRRKRINCRQWIHGTSNFPSIENPWLENARYCAQLARYLDACFLYDWHYPTNHYSSRFVAYSFAAGRRILREVLERQRRLSHLKISIWHKWEQFRTFTASFSSFVLFMTLARARVSLCVSLCVRVCVCVCVCALLLWRWHQVVDNHPKRKKWRPWIRARPSL